MTRAPGPSGPVILPLRPSDARRELKALLVRTRWCRVADTVVLAVHEALVNADRHGGGALRLQASVERDALVVVVCDRGPGFDFPDSSRRGAWSESFAEDGRGLWLICQIASRAETRREDGEFCVCMRFDAPGGPARR